MTYKDLADKRNHIESIVEINSEKDFDNWLSKETIEILTSTNDNFNIYRGQFDSSWKVVSTLLRIWQKNINDIQKKHKTFNSAEIHYHKNNDSNTNNDAQLNSHNQHYGIETSIIDFTLCPYVSLYFAIEGKSSDITENDMKDFISIIKIKKNLELSNWEEALLCAKEYGAPNSILNDAFFKDLSEISHPVLIKEVPAVRKITNNRMNAQKGVFIYLGSNSHLPLDDVFIEFNKLNHPICALPQIEYIHINRSLHEYIKKTLESKGINKEYLLP